MAKFNLKEFDDFGARSAGKERAFAQQQHAAPVVVQPQKEKAEKRAKMPMMNIRFTPDNYEYMRKRDTLFSLRRFELLGAISLLSPEYLLSYERRPSHEEPPDHFALLSYLLDLFVSQSSPLLPLHSSRGCHSR